ncbi:DUF6011 domain-containing protein [Paractinoplanes atraurantiacus]|uniref:Uncharacterized protein n=1 Tax=Paractinoplanes atraurantiacus TaxID=1036182 RepID=A0A285GZF7_9ACTN|nr:DUF6011 domain-containing protein [Actinoplanes atraurantiacus]SNY28902.1 hypothetical protein SAMN05421748_103154 [Actinoplanes atraurantiacus]
MTEQPVEPVYCEICKRKLRTPESRRRGRGRVCDEKVSSRPGTSGRSRDHSPRTGGQAPMPMVGPDLLDELAASEPAAQPGPDMIACELSPTCLHPARGQVRPS